ncbi:MAG: restriction endonuclease subunit S [Thauera sp.]|nr:restriction endonuclease subunit S [Thauera sp.]
MSGKGTGAMGEEDNEKSALVPRLRFPLFSEAWRADRVGKIADIFKGKGIAKSDVSNDGIHPCIRYGELYTVYGELVTEVLSRTSLPASDLFFGESNDVIIPSSGETKEDIATAACVIPGRIAFGGDLNVLRTKEIGVFLSYYLNGPLRKGIARVAQGNSVVHLYPHQIEKLPIAVPARNEQQKIADCLSSLDELITAESQKLDALKTHKKGLMRQLFPREGETVPRLRFPEFQEEREWEEVMLGEIAEIKLGKMLDSKKHTTGTLLPYLNNLAVRWNEVNTSNLPKMYFDKDELDRFGLMDGDVVVCEGGEPGRSAVWDGRLPDLKFQKAVHRVRFKVPFEPRLLVLFLESIAGTPRLESLFTGGGIKHLTQEVFARLKIPFTTHAEQQRISGCLASLDDLIIAQAKKIDIFKTQKQGLMQQLFPVLDEVSA